MSEKKEPTHIPVTQWGNTGDEKHDAALLKLKEISDRVSTLSDKVLYTFDVAGAFKRVDGNSSLVNIGELAELMAPIVEYYEANQDIIDRLEDWPALTGLTRDELDQMELQEVVALIRERSTRQIQTTDTLELIIVDTAKLTPTKPSGAIYQAEATRSIYELYSTIPSGPITSLTKILLHNPKRVTSTRRGQIKQAAHYRTGDSIITYKGKDSNFTVTLAKEFKKIPNGPRVFNFLLEKLNEQNFTEVITFATAELINRGIYTNKDSAVKGMRNCLKNMQMIRFDGDAAEYNAERKKINQAYSGAVPIGQYQVNYTLCEIYIPPIIRRDARGFYPLPEWSYRLNDNAYFLLDYIYAMARQNYTKINEVGHFNIKLDTVRSHLGLPTPKADKKHQEQRIRLPIEKAIEEIEEGRAGTDIKITPMFNNDPQNVTEWLQGWVRIELDEIVIRYMKERAIDYQKEKLKEARRIEAAKIKVAERAVAKAIQEAAASIEK